MSSDDGSQLESLWNTTANVVTDAYNAWGWVVPAMLLTALFFAVVLLFCYVAEDVPLELEMIRAPKAIFRWTRKHWDVD